MDLKFKELLQSYIPKGKAWEENHNFDKILGGFSGEFSRVYSKIKTFYDNFNIIKSNSYAVSHSSDYLIVQGLYNNPALQHIIIEYLNKDYDFIEALEDFASFINVTIKFLNLPTPFEVGFSQVGDELGDPTASSAMNLFIRFDDINLSCDDYNRVRWLAEYLKPPYLNILYANQPTNKISPFEVGFSQVGDELGGIETCTIIL
tara:strand:+ start:2156 stop:2767 length:612 start_codon:yes stop_codon:yes gene_type:complete